MDSTIKKFEATMYGCNIYVSLESAKITTKQAKEFIEHYVHKWQMQEKLDDFLYTPHIRRDKEDINVRIWKNKRKIFVTINGNAHISMNKIGFNNMQMLYEQETNFHGLFFQQAHMHENKSGYDIFKLFGKSKFWKHI